jgi:hypothetical protein
LKLDAVVNGVNVNDDESEKSFETKMAKGYETVMVF